MESKVTKSFLSFIEETEFFDLLTSAKLVLFRGQGVRGSLLPGIARKDPQENTSKKEREVLAQLKLMGASMLNGGTDLDYLVMAQHFGLKTRLLDWTSNPLAALWFACSDKQDGDAYVYALEVENEHLSKNTYEDDPFVNSGPTRVFQPRLNNPRIIAQQGWFTLHRYSKSTERFVPLEKNEKMKEKLHEFCIPAGQKKEILASLGRHGVNTMTVFPDLAGLCQHLNWAHDLGVEKVKPEHPAARGVRPVDVFS